MRKIALFSVFLYVFFQPIYALKDCTDLSVQYEVLKEDVVETMEHWKTLSNTDSQKVIVGKTLSDLLSQGVKLENELNDCLSSVKEVNKLITTYLSLGNEYFKRKQWENAIGQYKKVLELDPGAYRAYYNIGSSYVNQGKLDLALEYYQKAKEYAQGKVQMQESRNAYDKIAQIVNKQQEEKTAPSDDTFSHLQYYLRVLSIPQAWKKVVNPKEVIVAVIDDGININHPDLTDRIWIDPNAEYGSSKIKDFVGDGLPDNLPTGEHGTMIAGIIGATGNNKKGIAGIAKNVKIMPLRVFDYKGSAREEHIINAMYFAINNGANIINLSLGQSQFNYSKKYDEVMQKAYDHGVIVIIAAGNGDVLAFSNSGINTTVNPISPVCNNEGNRKYSFGVEALDQKGTRARWSNYGSCVSFSAPGENIFSTSISVFNKESGVDYATDSGTSFAAPMIAGVVALGYNKYGYVSPDTVYQALSESLVPNEAKNLIINADKYIDALGKKTDKIQKEQKEYYSTPRQVATPSQIKDKKKTVMNDSDFLIEKGLVGKKSIKKTDLQQMVQRQEVIAMAMRILNIYLPKNYTCKGMYKDVTATTPNNWICQVAEVATEKGILNIKGSYLKPEENINLLETLNILMKAGNIPLEQFVPTADFSASQMNIFATALSYDLVDGSKKITPKTKTLRSDLYRITRKILLRNS